MSQPGVLAFAGSARRESFNGKLIRAAVRSLDESDFHCTLLDLRDYELPIYDGDLEATEGLPKKVLELQEIFKAHNVLLIASPEYNSSFSPLLKNTIDWVSRASDTTPSLAAYKGKIAAIMAASPGALGGMRGLVALRSLLSNIGVTVLANEVTIRQAHQAFDADDNLVDAENAERVRTLTSELVSIAEKLGA